MHGKSGRLNESGYTLLESLLQLSTLIVFAHITVIVLLVVSNVEPLFRDVQEMEWEMFSAELAHEISISETLSIHSGGKGISLKQQGEQYEIGYYSAMIRKQKVGRGHEPLLLSVRHVFFSKEGNTLQLNVEFEGGKKRERTYVISSE